jgi:mannose-6-phosphate isomerase-like protein (cupin superfamily)
MPADSSVPGLPLLKQQRPGLSSVPGLPLLKQQRPGTTRGYLVRRVQDAPTVDCPCGKSTRPLTAADNGVCNLHVTLITDSVKHYHRETTEVYYILQGRGKMELNDDVIDVEPGMVIYIEPGTAHRLVSPEGVQTLVVGIPAYREDDEFFVT